MSPAGPGRKEFVNIPVGLVKVASGSDDRAFRGPTVGSQPECTSTRTSRGRLHKRGRRSGGVAAALLPGGGIVEAGEVLMSPWVAAALQILLVFAALALVHVPLGNFMTRMYTSDRDNRVERAFYRVLRIDAKADQRWSTYLISVLAFSVVSILLLWALLSLNHVLPFAFDRPAMPAAQGFNTAVSFVTNTNWQSYSGESALGYTVQAIGLTVQNFLSAGVGMAVVVALIRGFTRTKTDRLGNFWVDLTRTAFRLLLPLSFLAALVLVGAGAIQNLNAPVDAITAAGGTQTIPGGLVASQEAIKELGTNGGGYYNANSAHPFENPNAFINLLEIFLLLVIPFSLPRTFGAMVGNAKQGYAILAAMVVLWTGALVSAIAVENAHPGIALQAAGAATEARRSGSAPRCPRCSRCRQR